MKNSIEGTSSEKELNKGNKETKNQIQNQTELSKEKIGILVHDQRNPELKSKFDLDKFINDLNRLIAAIKNSQRIEIEGWGQYQMEHDSVLIDNILKAKAIYIEATTSGKNTNILVVTVLKDDLFDKVMLSFRSNEVYTGHATYEPGSKDQFKKWFERWNELP